MAHRWRNELGRVWKCLDSIGYTVCLFGLWIWHFLWRHHCSREWIPPVPGRVVDRSCNQKIALAFPFQKHVFFLLVFMGIRIVLVRYIAIHWCLPNWTSFARRVSVEWHRCQLSVAEFPCSCSSTRNQVGVLSLSEWVKLLPLLNGWWRLWTSTMELEVAWGLMSVLQWFEKVA